MNTSGITPNPTASSRLVSPPVAPALDVVARSIAEIGRADDEDREALRPGLVASPRARRDAHRVPFLELDDLVVELRPDSWSSSALVARRNSRSGAPSKLEPTSSRSSLRFLSVNGTAQSYGTAQDVPSRDATGTRHRFAGRRPRGSERT
jgi:hypothetical protein